MSAEPEIARDAWGVQLWRHHCGAVAGAQERPSPHRDDCCGEPGSWRALYLIRGRGSR